MIDVDPFNAYVSFFLCGELTDSDLFKTPFSVLVAVRSRSKSDVFSLTPKLCARPPTTESFLARNAVLVREPEDLRLVLRYWGRFLTEFVRIALVT